MKKDKFDLFMKLLTTETFTPEQWEEVKHQTVHVDEEPIQGKHISKDTEEKIKLLLAKNVSPTKIAKTCNVSRTTVYRYIQKQKALDADSVVMEKERVDLLEIFPEMKKNMEDTGLPF